MSSGQTHIFLQGYTVDLHQGPDKAYYVIMRDGSNEILGIGEEPTMEAAEARARWTIIKWGGKEDAKAAAASVDDFQAS